MTAKPSRHWSKCRACHKRVYAPAQRCECGGEPYASVEWARAGNVTALRTFEELVESAMAAVRLLPHTLEYTPARITLHTEDEIVSRLARMPGATERRYVYTDGRLWHVSKLERDGVEVDAGFSRPATDGEFGAHGVSEFLRAASIMQRDA